MKKTIIVLLCCFILNSIVASDADNAIGVTFASNSEVSKIVYYLDESYSTALSTAEKLFFSAGDRIYAQHYSSPRYELVGFNLYWYDENGNRQDNPVFIDSTESIVIPPKTVFSELSVEPVGKFSERTITFSDTVGGTEKLNIWSINNKTYTEETSAKINYNLPYAVSLKYDDNTYYPIACTPKNDVVVAEGGTVVFFEEDPSSNSRVTESYSVELREYSFITIADNHKRIKSILYGNRELSVEELQKLPLRVGDTITIETERNYLINGPGILIDQSITPDSRRFIITIPDIDIINFILHISESEAYSVSLNFEDVREGEDYPETTVYFKDQIRNGYTEIQNKGSIDISDGEELTLYMRNLNPTREQITLTYVYSNGQQEIQNVDDRIEKTFKFSHTAKSNLTDINVNIDYGLLLSSTPANSDDITVTYYIDGKEITQPIFLKDGTTVTIVVRNCPEDREINHSDRITETENDTYQLVISKITTAADFNITTKARNGFYFNPSDYSYEHGTVVFKWNNAPMDSITFLPNDSTITYEGIYSDEGYSLIPGEIKVNGQLTEINLRDIEFTRDELKLVKLNQPEYGGSIKYYYDGKIISEREIRLKAGETVEMQFRSDSGYDVKRGIDKEYVVNENKEQSLPEENPFIELEDHKPELWIIFDSITQNFEINTSRNDVPTLKTINVSNDKERNKNEGIEEKGTFSKYWDVGKIGTHQPLKMTYNGLTIGPNQALKVSRTDVIGGKSFLVEEKYFPKHGSGAYIISFDAEQIYETIQLTFSVVTGDFHTQKTIPNAEIVVKYSGSFDAKEINPGDFVEPNSKVEVIIDPTPGYYITGSDINDDGNYRKIMNYSNYQKDIDSIIEKHPVIKYVQLELPAEDDFGYFSYEYNGKFYSKSYDRFRVGDKITITYEPKDGYKLARRWYDITGKIFSSNKISKDIEITSEMNGILLTVDMGVDVKDEAKNDEV